VALAVTTRSVEAIRQRDRLAALLNTADLVEAPMAATAFQEQLHAAGT
jgi:hypothetical protein